MVSIWRPSWKYVSIHSSAERQVGPHTKATFQAHQFIFIPCHQDLLGTLRLVPLLIEKLSSDMFFGQQKVALIIESPWRTIFFFFFISFTPDARNRTDSLSGVFQSRVWPKIVQESEFLRVFCWFRISPWKIGRKWAGINTTIGIKREPEQNKSLSRRF